MQSIIYKGPGKFAIEDRPKPISKKADDVMIKVLGVCICGTDINIFATPLDFFESGFYVALAESSLACQVFKHILQFVCQAFKCHQKPPAL